MENENLIGVYLKLLSVLECPVCLDYLTKPVALCNEGHALCSKCKSNISSCPMCRNPISSTRGLIIDQIIETLLYPCYKMGCGSLLKRSDAESHDLNCNLENAPDKQAVLHNNLLKNIEENFASFIVQPEIVKETRTVGTVTGKVKTADARVQTAIPFSSSQLKDKLNAGPLSSAGSSRTLPLGGPGISISSMENPSNNIFSTGGLTNIAMSFPQNSLCQNAFTFSMTPDGVNNTSMSLPQESSFKFTLDPYQKSVFTLDSPKFDTSSKPFVFNSKIEKSEKNLGAIPKKSSRKPSTNLSFGLEKAKLPREPEPAASNDFVIRNVSESSANLPSPSIGSEASNSSFASASGLLSENMAAKSKPSTNLVSCSTLVNSNNSDPFVPNNSLLTSTHRKRPTTNLCGLA